MASSAAIPEYFQLFDLPVAFDIDNADLASRYRELARALHPDRFARSSDQERRMAAQKMALLNEAYQALKDPLARARYLLSCRGVDIEKAATDTAFLMEQMELRERFDAVRGGDASLAALTADVRAALDEREQRLRGLFVDSGRYADAPRVVQEMQFLRRLSQQIQDMEESNPSSPSSPSS